MTRSARYSFYTIYCGLVGSFLLDLAHCGDPGEEDIHRLRLDVKRLRAALDLAEFVAKKRAWTRRLRTELSGIFDRAGDVRTARMNLRRLMRERPDGSGDFERWLIGEAETRGRDLAALMAKFDRERFALLAAETGAVIRGLENARVAVYARKFIDDRYDAISGILSRSGTTRGMHEVRKHLRSVRNTISLVPRPVIGRRSGIEERILRTADQALGAWHDEVVFLDDLRRYLSGNNKAAAGKPLRAFAASVGKRIDAELPAVVRDTRRRMAALRRVLKIH